MRRKGRDGNIIPRYSDSAESSGRGSIDDVDSHLKIREGIVVSTDYPKRIEQSHRQRTL